MTHVRAFATSSLIGAAGAVVFLAVTGLGGILEERSLDWRFRLRPPPEASSPVVMVVLRGQRVRPPGRRLREDLADLLEALVRLPVEQHPEAVVVDIALTLPGGPAVSGRTASERIVRATRELGNVVHAGIFTYREDEIRDTPRDVRCLEPFSLSPSVGLPAARVARGVQLPPAPFMEELFGASAGVGFISLAPRTPGDVGAHVFPMVTRFRSQGGSGGERDYLSLSLAGVCSVLCGTRPLEACLGPVNGGIEINGIDRRVVPLDGRGGYLVNHRKRFRFLHEGLAGKEAARGRAGYPEVVMFDPFGEAAGRFLHLDGRPLESLDAFVHRVLLVVDGQERSLVRGPLGPDYLQAAVHAQIMANILEDDYLRVVPGAVAWALVIAAAGAGLLWRVRHGGPVRRGGVSASKSTWRIVGSYLRSLMVAPEPILGAAWLAIAVGLFQGFNLVVPVAYPLAVLAGSFLGWRFMVPRHLARELHRQQGLLETHAQESRVLEEQIRRLEAARDDALRRVADEVRRGEEPAGPGRLPPRQEPGWERALEELDALDRVLESARATLAGTASGLGVAVSTEVGADGDRVLLDKLGEGTAQVRAAQARLEAVQQELLEVEPSIERYRRWYQTWAPAYEGVVRQLRGILDVAVDRLVTLSTPPPEVPEPRHEAPTEPDPDLFARTGLLTCDSRMSRILRDLVDLYGPLDAPVLILGETGTGKELVARAIHANSPRSADGRAAVFENCANLDPNLAASKLFGHRKGAFSGAHTHREGVLVEADGGTLVLDELGELPVEVQGMLLRVLETGEVKPVGGSEKDTRHVDVRIIASTNVDLEAEVEKGRFRADLYHRLRRLPPVRIPPLRERPADIPLLVDHFWEQACAKFEKSCRLDPDARRFLTLSYHWPGNVRELQNVITGLVAMSRAPTVTAADVREHLGPADMAAHPATQAGHVFTPEELSLLRIHRRERFVMRACGAAEDYPGNRATADRHFRILLAKALSACKWDLHAAATLIAGDDPDLVERVAGRARRFVSNLAKRTRAARNEPEKWDALKKSIKREYSPHHEQVFRLVDAIRHEWLSPP